MNQTDFLVLEGMVDRYGLSEVVKQLADMCGQKSEHVLNTWGDESLARGWSRNERILDMAAAKLPS